MIYTHVLNWAGWGEALRTGCDRGYVQGLRVTGSCTPLAPGAIIFVRNALPTPNRFRPLADMCRRRTYPVSCNVWPESGASALHVTARVRSRGSVRIGCRSDI